jgi:hypothetical protein
MMKEFYIETTNQAPIGPLELNDALSLIPFYVAPIDKQRARDAYASGESYTFNFSYGFNSSTVSVRYIQGFA